MKQTDSEEVTDYKRDPISEATRTDLITAKNSLQGSTSNNVRGVMVGGFKNPGTNVRNIEHVTIASTGNASDFGDLNYRNRGLTATSDSHGGL